MEQLLEQKIAASPFMNGSENGTLAAPAAPNNLLGVCSIQDFSGSLGNHGSDLSQTHADARGFYTYLYNWYTANFWFTDGAVQTWLYEEPYDHWQNYYGVDAVCVFYHSGHGAMTSTGVFEAPTGGKWNNETWIFSNNKMLLANQRARYIFWSTCFSCRVGDGITPITTWWNDDANPGFRMLFGFETTSVDSGDYGKNFWNHYKSGESFSNCWMNGSWDISHHQAPSVVASGNNQAEANNILFNEKLFQWGTVNRNWYQWRWYIAAALAARNKTIPKELMIAELAPFEIDRKNIQKLADNLGFSKKSADEFGISKEGIYLLNDKDKNMAINQDGHINARLAAINHENRSQLSEDKARRIAEDFISQNVDKDTELVFNAVRLGKTCGGSTKKSGKLDDEYVTDTTIEYRQVINGVPTVNTDNGLVRVTVDNDGAITNIHNSIKKLRGLTTKPQGMNIDPRNNGTAFTAGAPDIEKTFSEHVSKYKSAKLIADADEIGYDVSGVYGKLVAQREYEVSFEKDLKKIIKATVPIFE